MIMIDREMTPLFAVMGLMEAVVVANKFQIEIPNSRRKNGKEGDAKVFRLVFD